MCKFCNGETNLETKLSDLPLTVYIESNEITTLNLHQTSSWEFGNIGSTLPIRIYFCPMCGRDF